MIGYRSEGNGKSERCAVTFQKIERKADSRKEDGNRRYTIYRLFQHRYLLNKQQKSLRQYRTIQRPRLDGSFCACGGNAAHFATRILPAIFVPVSASKS